MPVFFPCHCPMQTNAGKGRVPVLEERIKQDYPSKHWKPCIERVAWRGAARYKRASRPKVVYKADIGAVKDHSFVYMKRPEAENVGDNCFWSAHSAIRSGQRPWTEDHCNSALPGFILPLIVPLSRSSIVPLLQHAAIFASTLWSWQCRPMGQTVIFSVAGSWFWRLDICWSPLKLQAAFRCCCWCW